MNRTKGIESENKAAWFLEQKGFVVIERNRRYPFGEIDLICLKEGLLVFAEVKSMVCTWDEGEINKMVSPSKQLRIKKAAGAYLASKPNIQYDEIRFDVVVIKGSEATHYEGAF